MVHQDPQIINPLKDIIEDSKQLIEDLESVQVVIKQLKEQLPVSKNNKSKCFRILQGGTLAYVGAFVGYRGMSTKTKRIAQADETIATNIGNIGNYLKSGGSNKRVGAFIEPWIYWNNWKNKIITYRNLIIKNLSYDDSFIIQKLNQDEFDKINSKLLDDLMESVTGFITLIDNFKGMIEDYTSHYQAGGIEAVNRASHRDLTKLNQS